MTIEPGIQANWRLVAPFPSGRHGGSPLRSPGERRRGDLDARFLFRIRGPISVPVSRAFPEMEVGAEGTDTLLTGILTDAAALYGVVAQLERLGLELLEIRRLPES
jgi:hypothetical protein